MRVLHVIGGRLNGGAARAALELHDALRRIDVDSHVLHSHGAASGPPMRSLETGAGSKLRRLGRSALELTLTRKLRRKGDGRGFSIGFFGVPVAPLAEQTDILHLHWIGSGSFRLPRWGGLPANTVWTFHDMWPLTGGCHYAFDCHKYETGCGACPALGSTRGTDVSTILQRQKARIARGGVHGVAISTWLAEQARQSAAMRGTDIETIPNLVDTEEFWPVPKSVARLALGLNPERKIILTGHVSNNFQKGGDLLAAALALLRQDKTVDFDLICFGKHDPALAADNTRHFGYVSDTTTLRLLYSAADVFAFPSRIEAFGRTIIEAFACGTPVSCFAGSGPDDIVVDLVTGTFAPKNDVAGFATGLRHCLLNSESMSAACRQRAEEVYSKPKVAALYKALYERVLAGGRK